MTPSFDFVIVGAGIVGLTTAHELRRMAPKSRILVLEKEGESGRHASGRNSGVLHAGIYYDPGTLKAKMCAQGAREMRAFCEEQGLPLVKSGKVVVPQDPSLDSVLDKLKANADACGVRTEIVDERTLLDLEPAARRVPRALHSPDTALIDPKATLARIAAILTARGIELRYDSPLLTADPKTGTIETKQGKISFGHLINAAGAHADKIAHAFGIAKHLSILPFRGSYFELSPASGIEIRGNVYPVPDLRFPVLGVHFTRSVSGKVHLGPTATPALGRENYQGIAGADWPKIPRLVSALARQYLGNSQGLRSLMHREMRHLSRSAFAREAAKLVPVLRPEHLVPSTKAGIRAQLYDHREDRLLMDFVIEAGPRSTHVLNAVSPAFTCSWPFARYVVEHVLGNRAPDGARES